MQLYWRMNFLTANDITKSLEICFLRQDTNDCTYCKECPVMMLGVTEHCQKFLAKNTISKVNELVALLDDKVNHHYYDTLESYQELNAELQAKLDKIESILTQE